MKKFITVFLCLGLIFQQTGFTQVAAAELNLAGYLSRPQGYVVPDSFRPPHLRYFSYDNLGDQFQILVDKGTAATPDKVDVKEETRALMDYFLVGVSLPDEVFWVNLRPDAEDQIMDPALAKTDVGKIFLEADLQLKKDTARFTSPETPEGKAYWDKLYKKAGELFGKENITIPTLTRPWIVPGEIIIRETGNSAYIYKATLKVMLESDYLKSSNNPLASQTYSFKDPRLKALNEYSSQIIRETIIPKLTKDINVSRRYSALRQVFYSLILARWFKGRFEGRAGSYASLINREDLTGLVSKEAWSRTFYFKEYQKSFKDGEYNVREPVYTPFGQAVRSYFSGGINFTYNRSLPESRDLTNNQNLPVNSASGIDVSSPVSGFMGRFQNMAGAMTINRPEEMTLFSLGVTGGLEAVDINPVSSPVINWGAIDNWNVTHWNNQALPRAITEQPAALQALKNTITTRIQEELIPNLPADIRFRGVSLYQGNYNLGLITLATNNDTKLWAKVTSAEKTREGTVNIKLDLQSGRLDQEELSGISNLGELQIQVRPPAVTSATVQRWDMTQWNNQSFPRAITEQPAALQALKNTITTRIQEELIPNLPADIRFRGFPIVNYYPTFNLGLITLANNNDTKLWAKVTSAEWGRPGEMDLKVNLQSARLDEEELSGISNLGEFDVRVAINVSSPVSTLTRAQNLQYETYKVAGLIYDLGPGFMPKVIMNYSSGMDRNKGLNMLNFDTREEGLAEAAKIARQFPEEMDYAFLKTTGFVMEKPAATGIGIQISVWDNWRPGMDLMETRTYKTVANREEAFKEVRNKLSRYTLAQLDYEISNYDFNFLNIYLDAIGEVKGSRTQPYKAAELKERIDAARELGMVAVKFVTNAEYDARAQGLQGVVERLVQNDTILPTNSVIRDAKGYREIIQNNVQSLTTATNSKPVVTAMVNYRGEITFRDSLSAQECRLTNQYGVRIEKNHFGELNYRFMDTYGGPAPQKPRIMLEKTIGEINSRINPPAGLVNGQISPSSLDDSAIISKNIQVMSSMREAPILIGNGRQTINGTMNTRGEIIELAETISPSVYRDRGLYGFTIIKNDLGRIEKPVFAEQAPQRAVDVLNATISQANSRISTPAASPVAISLPDSSRGDNMLTRFDGFESVRRTIGIPQEVSAGQKVFVIYERNSAGSLSPQVQIAMRDGKPQITHVWQGTPQELIYGSMLRRVSSVESDGGNLASARWEYGGYPEQGIPSQFTIAYSARENAFTFEAPKTNIAIEPLRLYQVWTVDDSRQAAASPVAVNGKQPGIFLGTLGIRDNALPVPGIGRILRDGSNIEVFDRRHNGISAFIISLHGNRTTIEVNRQNPSVSGLTVKPGIQNEWTLTSAGRSIKVVEQNLPDNLTLEIPATQNGLFDIYQTPGVSAASPVDVNAMGNRRITLPQIEQPGGIDLRTMEMMVQPMGTFSGLNFTLPQLSGVNNINLDEKFREMRNMVDNNIIPSGERLKELLAAAFAKNEFQKRADEILLCLVDVCRLEEELGNDSSPELREALVIFDTQRFVIQ